MNMNKKIVHYSEIAPGQSVSVGSRVLLTPVDHPDVFSVANGQPALTTSVVSYHEETGIIETANTVYVPA